MKIIGLFFFLTIFILGIVFAECSEGQININTASLEELDKIVYVGPATANKIISARPFNSVNELTNVSGIGEVKLKAIKGENLACVEGNDEEEDVEEKEETVEEIKEESEKISENLENIQEEFKEAIEKPSKIQKVEIIKLNSLNSKDIKENNSNQENKKEGLIAGYAFFGIILLGISLVILLFLQRKKNGLE
jgi:competence ComEA-like helix-hairpin-helix protein